MLYILFQMFCTQVVTQRLEWCWGIPGKCEHVNFVVHSHDDHCWSGPLREFMGVKKFPESNFALEPYPIIHGLETISATNVLT